MIFIEHVHSDRSHITVITVLYDAHDFKKKSEILFLKFKKGIP